MTAVGDQVHVEYDGYVLSVLDGAGIVGVKLSPVGAAFYAPSSAVTVTKTHPMVGSLLSSLDDLAALPTKSVVLNAGGTPIILPSGSPGTAPFEVIYLGD